MKLLENIVKNVPRRKIPEGAEYFAQDRDKEFFGYEFRPKPDNNTDFVWEKGSEGGGAPYITKDIPLSDDAATTIVTREELMRAYDLVEQGYTLWFGGDCPVEGWVHVDFVSNQRFVTDCKPAHCLNWEKIFAYKVSKAIQPATPTTGVKHDSGKPRFSLLPLKQVWQVVEVLEFGAKKYAPDNWRKVDNQRERYFNAAQRHLAAWWQGEKKDPETGLSHLAHVACCVLFLMWGDDNDQNSR